jgi:hypothetical protein
LLLLQVQPVSKETDTALRQWLDRTPVRKALKAGPEGEAEGAAKKGDKKDAKKAAKKK